MGESVQVNVKLEPGTERLHMEESLSRVPGVKNVIHTFPDEQDEELLRLYVLEVDPSVLESTLVRLRAVAGVAYAEPAASRGIKNSKR